MNSKQMREVERLRGEVKLVHLKAQKREMELRKAGVHNNVIKIDPVFVCRLHR